MEDRGYSRLARLSGLSVSFISRLFSGKGNPTLNTLIRLADARHMTVDRFVKELMRSRSARRGGSDSR